MKHSKIQCVHIRTALVACVILFCCARAFGQSTTTVEGMIVDPSGAVVPGVNVRLQCDCKECPGKPCDQCCPSGFSASATSGDDGHFRIENVPNGVYWIMAGKEGFGTAEAHGVEVSPQASRSITLTLGPDEKKASSMDSQIDSAAKESERVQIQLKVMSDDIGPVEQAKITVRSLCECRIECPTKPCEECCPSHQVFTTDSSGVVQFTGAAGKYLISADYKSYSKDIPLTIKPGTTEKVKIELALKMED